MRNVGEALWLLLGISLFLIPISISILSANTRKSQVFLLLTLLSWIALSAIIGNGIPNPFNPTASILLNSQKEIFALDGYFASVIGIALLEIYPAFFPSLCLNSLVALIGIYLFLKNFDYKEKKNLLLALAVIIPFPILMISLFSLERSITSSIIFFFFLLHAWQALKKKDPLSHSEIAWILFLAIFAALLKIENTISVFLIVLFLAIKKRRRSIFLLFLGICLFMKGIEFKAENTHSAAWKHGYFASNLLATVSYIYFESDRNQLGEDDRILWEKIYDFESLSNIYSKWGTDNVKFPPRKVDDQTWNAFLNSFLKFAIQNPAFIVKARFILSLGAGNGEIPSIYDHNTKKSFELTGMGLVSDLSKIDGLVEIYQWVAKHLSFSVWILPLFFISFLFPFSKSFVLTAFTLPHAIVVFLMIPSSIGFYWLTVYFWSCASPFLVAYEYLDRNQ